MQIHGIEGMTYGELEDEIRRGARFVIFQYVVSVVILTFKQPTNIYFIRAGEGTFGKAIGPTLATFFLGWWGFPFGIIYSIEVLVRNLSGGKDLTDAVMDSIRQG